MEKVIKQYSQDFYDKNVSIGRMVCLGLLSFDSYEALNMLDDMTDDLDAQEYANLFGIEPVEEDERDEPFIHELTIEKCHGWLIEAQVAEPRNVDFKETGKIRSYSTGGVYFPILVYAATFEEALKIIKDKADTKRNAAFNKARREQGLTEQPLEVDA